MHAEPPEGSLGRRVHSRIRCAQLGQQLLALFLEDGEQLRIDRVDGVDVVLVVQRVAPPLRFGAPPEAGRRTRTSGCPSSPKLLTGASGVGRDTAGVGTGAGRFVGKLDRQIAAHGERLDLLRRRHARGRPGAATGPAAPSSGSRRRTGAAGGGSRRRCRRTAAPRPASPRPLACERISACSSRRASCDRSPKPTVADCRPASGPARSAWSPTGRCSSCDHSASSVHEAARLLVRLVQEDVEQRDADAQRADHLVRLGFGAAGGGRRLRPAQASARAAARSARLALRLGSARPLGARRATSVLEAKFERRISSDRIGLRARGSVGPSARAAAACRLRQARRVAESSSKATSSSAARIGSIALASGLGIRGRQRLGSSAGSVDQAARRDTAPAARHRARAGAVSRGGHHGRRSAAAASAGQRQATATAARMAQRVGRAWTTARGWPPCAARGDRLDPVAEIASASVVKPSSSSSAGGASARRVL